LRWKKNSSADLQARSVRERKRRGPAVSGSRERRGAPAQSHASWAGEKEWAERRGGKLGGLGWGKNEGVLGWVEKRGAGPRPVPRGFPLFLFIFFSFSKTFSKRVFLNITNKTKSETSNTKINAIPSMNAKSQF